MKKIVKIETLTVEEREFIEKFRELSEEQKQEIIKEINSENKE